MSVGELLDIYNVGPSYLQQNRSVTNCQSIPKSWKQKSGKSGYETFQKTTWISGEPSDTLSPLMLWSALASSISVR